MHEKKRIQIDVTAADALEFDADVLALKYAQKLYGVDRAVYSLLTEGRPPIDLPRVGEFKVAKSEGRIAARTALFIGVGSLRDFSYAEIRDFSWKVMAALAGELPTTRHLALTLHGPGYGLDETEAFEAELAGLVDALTSGDYPPALDRISFVERNDGRANRLHTVLERVVPDGFLPLKPQYSRGSAESHNQATLRTAGYGSAAKRHVFVAMPFAEEMNDLFHYGIQGAVNGAGMLCERADLSSFTGDVMDWIKRRIATSTLVIADLSTANPNVYLEVGYAWGCRVPTVLLVKDPSRLTFDVRSQRCIVYKTIRQLEELLKRELQGFPEFSASDQTSK